VEESKRIVDDVDVVVEPHLQYGRERTQSCWIVVVRMIPNVPRSRKEGSHYPIATTSYFNLVWLIQYTTTRHDTTHDTNKRLGRNHKLTNKQTHKLPHTKTTSREKNEKRIPSLKRSGTRAAKTIGIYDRVEVFNTISCHTNGRSFFGFAMKRLVGWLVGRFCLFVCFSASPSFCNSCRSDDSLCNYPSFIQLSFVPSFVQLSFNRSFNRSFHRSFFFIFIFSLFFVFSIIQSRDKIHSV